jgi:hypothetical protein
VFLGQTLRFTTDEAHRLIELRFAKSPHQTTLFRKEGAVQDGRRAQGVTRSPALPHAVVEAPLFEAGIDSGVSHATILELANVFGGVIDFALDPRKVTFSACSTRNATMERNRRG